MRIVILANACAVHTQRWASALGERGHDVFVVSIRQAVIPNATVISKFYGPPNSPTLLWTLLSYLRLLWRANGIVRTIRPDLINPHYCITYGTIAALTTSLTPRVVNIWGSDVHIPDRLLIKHAKQFLVSLSLRRANAIASTSEFMARSVQKYLKDPPPIHIVPFGVDIEKFTPSKRSRRLMNPTRLRVGFIKTLRPRYAPKIFLEAAYLVTQRGFDIEFIIAGEGPMRAHLQRYASNRGILNRTTFCGFVPHERVPDLMASLDILVNCSNQESFGVVICEASACAIPVIATDVGGTRETLLDGQTGILVPPSNAEALADAIIILANNPEKRQLYGNNGRQWVCQNYVWEENVSTFLKLLHRVT